MQNAWDRFRIFGTTAAMLYPTKSISANIPPKPPNPVLAVVLAPKPVAAGCVLPNGEAAGAPNADVPAGMEDKFVMILQMMRFCLELR
jgi:hypothetical protein